MPLVARWCCRWRTRGRWPGCQGNIARIELIKQWETNFNPGLSSNYHEIVRYSLRERGPVAPEGMKQLYEFQRIRCTICLTSPENHQRKRPHLESVCLPVTSFMVVVVGLSAHAPPPRRRPMDRCSATRYPQDLQQQLPQHRAQPLNCQNAHSHKVQAGLFLSTWRRPHCCPTQTAN